MSLLAMEDLTQMLFSHVMVFLTDGVLTYLPLLQQALDQASS